ncbi:MAG TPA: ABC transporter substrate-binding protein [Thermodesulfovibrionales bacterium]|nr:ABC transporter substrate-binding protein [Thermodesulfovibrionales bacterium]
MKKVIGVFLLFLVMAGVLVSEAASKKIRIGYLRNDLHHLAAWVAMDKGFFREEGIEVEVAGIFNAGPEEMSAFASKSLDIGYLGVAPSATGTANKSAKVKAVALANAEGSSIVVRKDSAIQGVEDLAGRTVAIPGYSSVQDFLLRKALEAAGVDPKKVNIIVIKPPEMIAALDTKQIDAFIAWEPHPSKSVTMGVGRVLISSSKIWKHHPCCIVAVEDTFFSKNPKKVRAFIKAHAKAIGYIKKNPAEALRIGMKYTGMDEATVREALGHIEYDYFAKEEDIKEYMQYLLRFGYVKNLNVDAFAREYLDMSILREVSK